MVTRGYLFLNGGNVTSPICEFLIPTSGLGLNRSLLFVLHGHRSEAHLPSLHSPHFATMDPRHSIGPFCVEKLQFRVLLSPFHLSTYCNSQSTLKQSIFLCCFSAVVLTSSTGNIHLTGYFEFIGGITLNNRASVRNSFMSGIMC